MTKGELKYEAEQYSYDVPIYQVEQQLEKIQKAYLAGAESREKRIAELESQIEKMKRCTMCKYSTRLGYCKIREHGGVCENRDKWEIKEE